MTEPVLEGGSDLPRVTRLRAQGSQQLSQDPYHFVARWALYVLEALPLSQEAREHCPPPPGGRGPGRSSRLGQ